MHKKKITLIPLLAALLFFTVLLGHEPLRASAEATGSFYIPDGAVAAGSNFNVTIEFSANDTIGTVQAAVTYNENYMQFVSGRGAYGGGGIVNISDFPDIASETMTVNLTFRALKEGSSQINLTNGSVISPDGISLSSSISAYAEITIAPGNPDASYDDSSDDSTDSSEDDSYTSSDGNEGYTAAYLQSLTIEVGELQPPFSPGIYDYTVKVPHDVDVFELEGVTGDITDTIWYEGSLYLQDGRNQRTVTVTSADGLVSNTYTVTIYRDYADGEGDEDEDSDTGDGYGEADDDESYEEAEAENADSEINGIRAPKKQADDSKTGMEELRDSLMPALYVAAAAIIIAVIILIVWIKNKTKNRLK